MMHGHEKSDPAIVAEKPTNKTERSVAEPVERRAGAKGNAHQQITDRALNRACQSAADRDPVSASKRDPLWRRVRTVALAPSELVGVAETVRARVV